MYIIRNLSVSTVCIILIIWIIGVSHVFSSDSDLKEINLGPLFYYKVSDDQKMINALGPVFNFEESQSFEELGVRPLFYQSYDKYRNKKDIDVLFPLIGYSSYEEDFSLQFLVYLISYKSDYRGSYTTRQFNFYPFIFGSFSEDEKDDYFALFPIYGNLTNRFFKDEIKFVLFPLYLQTKKGGSVNNNIIWPFFGYYSGEGEEGFKIWPIYGYKKKDSNKLDEKFILWPFYTERSKTFYDDNIYIRSFLPFYSEYKSNYIENKSYFWPFINYHENRKKGIYRYDAPWPFINITRGNQYENRVFPVYSREEYNSDEEGFVLWPIYRYKNISLDDYTISRKSFMLFFYKDIEEIPANINGRSSRRIELWPIFTYQRDRDGNRSFRIFSVLEPFLPNNRPIENNFSSFWRIYEKTISYDGKSTTKLLWNVYRSETDSDSKIVSISPILPLFKYDRNQNIKKYEILGGLVEFKKIRITDDKEFAYNIIN